jgi:myo-inositol 2-dehydrogenase/D-chiro-inositol 1-dehydrogenase
VKGRWAELRVGVVGAGGMGSRHARNLLGQGAAVVAVADSDPERARSLAEACGGARTYEDGAELVRDPDVEAVVVASPDPTHARYVLACLQAEKPVFCEKPLATTVQDAEEVVRRELACGRRLVQVGFQRRYDPEFRALRRAVEEGLVGRPVLFRAWHRNARAAHGPPGSNEAVIVNSAIHDLDELRWLAGAEVEVVHAVVGRSVDPSLGEGILDLQVMQLGLTGGALALVELNLSAGYGYEVGVEVVGDQGSLSAGLPSGVVARREGRCGVSVPGDWLARFEDAYAAEVASWVDTLRSGGPPWPHAWDGYAALVAARACAHALRTGGAVRLTAENPPPLYAA